MNCRNFVNSLIGVIFSIGFIKFCNSETKPKNQTVETTTEEITTRPKRGYYFYGHPHSPNFFDRYFAQDQVPGEDNEDSHSQQMYVVVSPQPGQMQRPRYPSGPKRESLGGRILNKFRDRTNNFINAASAVAFAHENNYEEEEHEPMGPAEDSEASGAFWNLYSTGRGHGGWSSGYGGYGKGVNKSAVGLLGFLSLLSLIQSGLTTTTAAPAAGGGGRNGKSLSANNEDLTTEPISEDRENQSQKIADIVMPLMNSFSVAIHGTSATSLQKSLECVLHPICTSNKQLVKEFGEHGKDVGIMLGNVLESMSKKRYRQLKQGQLENELMLRLKYAARSGRNGKECEKHYPKCDNHKV